MTKTDCRDCLFYNGHFCKLPFFSNSKKNLWDNCIDFEPKQRRRDPGTMTLREVRDKFTTETSSRRLRSLS